MYGDVIGSLPLGRGGVVYIHYLVDYSTHLGDVKSLRDVSRAKVERNRGHKASTSSQPVTEPMLPPHLQPEVGTEPKVRRAIVIPTEEEPQEKVQDDMDLGCEPEERGNEGELVQQIIPRFYPMYSHPQFNLFNLDIKIVLEICKTLLRSEQVSFLLASWEVS